MFIKRVEGMEVVTVATPKLYGRRLIGCPELSEAV